MKTKLEDSLPPVTVDEACKKFAEYTAYLYYYLATEVVDRYGEEGKALLRDAIRKFGYNRGERVRAEVEAMGLEPTMENEYLCHDIPLGSKAFSAESSYEGDKRITKITKCTFGDTWKKLGADEIGRIYCDVDFAIWAGYNKDIRFQLEHNIFEGHDHCLETYEPLTDKMPSDH
jgi:hypothetical protein